MPPPIPRINDLSENGRFIAGNSISFTGIGTDSEDGTLSGTSLSWTSDVDGLMGTGEFVTSDILSIGRHQITLTATDSKGSSGIDTVDIKIISPPMVNGNFPDTGQTLPYSNIYGEDSDYIINPPSYTKLDDSGNELDDNATDWGMVRDNVTGLVWEVKTDDNGIHDKDNTYNWSDRNHLQNVFITQLNTDHFGSFSDWRIPTIKELSSLIHSHFYWPTINTAYFPNTIHDQHPLYSSSTINAGNPNKLWGVNFGSGYIYSEPDSHYFYVRAVRGEHNSNNLVDNGDGTVTDLTSSLMWQQIEVGGMTWEQALIFCEDLEFSGYDDWRLPNRNELLSIVDHNAHDPAINKSFFPNCNSSGYWSSTTVAGVTTDAWYCFFLEGTISTVSKSRTFYVRAVRGGRK